MQNKIYYNHFISIINYLLSIIATNELHQTPHLPPVAPLHALLRISLLHMERRALIQRQNYICA